MASPPHATHASVLKPPGLLAFRGGHRRRAGAPPSVLVQMRWGSVPNRGFWTKISQRQEVGSIKVSSAGYTPGEDDIFSEAVQEFKVDGPRTTFIAKLAVALGIAATITVVSICLRRPTLESSSWIPTIIDSSSASVPNVANAGFTFSLFKYKIVLPEYTPGWIYFWLLMAAGCGLFISEEALNVWVCPLCWLAYH